MKPAIVIQTDFSRDSSAVAAMIGVCQSVDAEVKVFDGNNGIPPFNIFAASMNLAQVAEFWPAGTVFVSVVDPGVGTARRGSVAQLTNGSYVVTPDNGALTHLYQGVGVAAIREIDMAVNRWPGTESCHIFHGRDVFAYTAIRLASGVIDFAGVGPEYPLGEMVTIDCAEPSYEDGLHIGIVNSAVPHFGLVSSNVPAEALLQRGLEYGDRLEVRISHGGEPRFCETMPFERSFGYVEPGQPLAHISSSYFMEVALRNESLAAKYGIEAGPDWRISFRKV